MQLKPRFGLQTRKIEKAFGLKVEAGGVNRRPAWKKRGQPVHIVVIDGHGGGIGAVVVKCVRNRLGESVLIDALGTNSIATSRMMKAGANRGATGENAIVHSAADADLIIGSIAILMANAMMGEMTEKMAAAISSSRARKILIPLAQEGVTIVGVSEEPLPHLVDRAVEEIMEVLENV